MTENNTTTMVAQPPQQQPKPEPKAPMTLGQGGRLQLQTVAEAMRFATAVVDSGLAPKGDTAAAVFVKLQAGAELGFPPMRALASLVVVNGRLTLQGDAMLALIRASGKGRVIVGAAGEGDGRHGFAEIERFDTGERDRIAFSWADAKRAGLAGKDTYKSYGDDMLIWKAVSRAAKRYFSDVIGGLESAEDARTYEVTPYRPEVSVVAPETRGLPAPPSEPDPLLVTPTSAEPPEAQREPGSDDCPHPDVPEARMKPGGLVPGESITCKDCGQVWDGPPVKAAEKGRLGRLA